VERLLEAAGNAMGVITLGTCAAYGGIPAASPNPTGAAGVMELLRANGVSTPVVNVPGCPPHPDWFVNTIAMIILNGWPQAGELDDFFRPKAFFGQLIHENCPRRACFDEGKFATKLSDPECLYELGCKGPITYADCPLRSWNNRTNWCVANNAPCTGCVEPGFPDMASPFYEKLKDVQIPSIGEYWQKKQQATEAG
jgi:hydrogenase small subunit